MKHTITAGSSFPISLELTDEHISMGYHCGNCHDDIIRLMELPEIKEQLEKISDEELNKWWGEFFIDNVIEHENATKERKLEWLVFECCSLGADGFFDDYDCSDDYNNKIWKN